MEARDGGGAHVTGSNGANRHSRSLQKRTSLKSPIWNLRAYDEKLCSRTSIDGLGPRAENAEKTEPTATNRIDARVTIVPALSGKPPSNSNSNSCWPGPNETSIRPSGELLKDSVPADCVTATILQSGMNSWPIRTRESVWQWAETTRVRGPVRTTDTLPCPRTISERTP